MRDINLDHKNITITVKRDTSDVAVSHREKTVDVSHTNKNITVDHTRNTVNVKRSDSELNVSHPEKTISLYNGGKRGVRGEQGIQGEKGDKGDKGDQGIPGIDGDKNFTSTFMPTDTLLVTHNLNKYPAVDVINSAGDEVIGNVNYLTLNSLIVSFSAAFGGRITCN